MTNQRIQHQTADFFISYTRVDVEWARWIAWHLESGGWTTIIQDWDFRAGEGFVLNMHHALKNTQRFIAVLTPDYEQSAYASAEWAAAFTRDPKGERGVLVPVRVRAYEPGGLLASIAYIDLVDIADDDQARAKLLAGVKRTRVPPTKPPPYPNQARAVRERPRFPGALPPTWNVAYGRNPNFTRREAELADLARTLRPGNPVVLAGLGGVGKTQIALEYIYQHTQEFNTVLWVNASRATDAAVEFAKLLTELGSSAHPELEVARGVSQVKRWLRLNTDWLLVFDGAQRPSVLENLLPLSPTGRVLITSRTPNWQDLASTISVLAMPESDAVELLVRYRRQQIEDRALDLANVLGRLPLALAQAGAYLRKTQQTVTKYLELLGTDQARLLQRGTASAAYKDKVANTWIPDFEEVRQVSPAASELLNLCAFLGSENIPRELFSAGVVHLPESLADAVSDTVAFSDAVDALLDHSLVAPAAETVSINSLVQAVVRDRLPLRMRRDYARTAVKLVNDAFHLPSSEPANGWATTSRLYLHVVAAASYAAMLDAGLDLAAPLLLQIGSYLASEKRYVDSRMVLRRAVDVTRRLYGPDDPRTAPSLQRFGAVLMELNDLDSARAFFEQSVRLIEHSAEPDDRSLATSLTNLATLLHKQGSVKDARAHLERAWRIRKRLLGPGHRVTMSTRTALESLPELD